MVYCVEEFLQVYIHCPLVSGFDVPSRSFHCVMRTSSRPKSVAMVTECPFEFFAQHLLQCLLDLPIEYCRDA